MVDGTLRNNNYTGDNIVANERIRTLLVILASFKNVKIMVWSGGGELYARQIARVMGITKYVDSYADKRLVSCVSEGHEDIEGHYHFAYDGPQPDIAIDDMHSFTLGALNLIVNEKQP